MAAGIHRIIDHQIRRWELEATARREEQRARPGAADALRPCITIARMFGAGGKEIAGRLSASLGYQILDREILDVLVREGRFRAQVLETLDERDRSSLELWVDGLLHGRIIDKGDYLRALLRVIGAIGVHGHAIIMGRGANFVVDSNKALRVRVVAPIEHRIEMVVRRRGIAYEQAEDLVQRTDHERSVYIQHHFHHHIEDPLAYDLTLNAETLGVDGAVALIERALRGKFAGRAGVQLEPSVIGAQKSVPLS